MASQASRVLEEGDVVGIDIGAYYKGYCGDSARTFPVGKVSPELKKLLEVTFEALNKGIDQCVAGKSDLGYRPRGRRNTPNPMVLRS